MLRVNPSEHPLLCTEPAWNTVENREKMMELAFEKFEFPAFYLAKDAVMTAYVCGWDHDDGDGKFAYIVYD